MTVLVINSGSSSIKYQLVDPESGEALAVGLVERIGQGENGHLKHEVNGEKHEFTGAIPDHKVGMEKLIEFFGQFGPNLETSNVAAVGHRVVQGGKYFDGPALVTDEVEKKIEDLTPLAPLHNGPALTGIRAARELFPDTPHVVVFDTAFFQSLPEEAARYALNREVADKYNIRRYGAHGTSHKYISQRVAEIMGRDDLKQIVLHIGNGASASAVDSGHAIDTSMGLTPLEGLMMGTRTGNIDPAAVFHLERVGGMSVDEVDKLFNKQSGLLGLTGESDLRAVHELVENGDENARVALRMYTRRIAKYIAAYTVMLGGLDAITFTAGVGEHDDVVRADVIEYLKPFGVAIDEEKNAAHASSEREISTPDSRVKVFVIPTNEEVEIARQAMTLV
ncbi:acetate/propionate family kinase [Neoactinobaculum massilliense]|uniref:acetate/propionate family kinase n=1 Tax=Neoactinobaculum massilliense TaxID=2364794 RepID=UPI000F53D8EF|nr:acetate kinase [Neoactinobaculum massilliense]